jgi:hypothetical protein
MTAKLLEKTVETTRKSNTVSQELSIVNENLLTLDQVVQLLQNQGASEAFIEFVYQDILQHGDLYKALA